jgi:hypothetical protein
VSKDKYLTTQEAAAEFGLPIGTLIKARAEGNGPKFIKLGSKKNSPLLYHPSDIQEWLDCRTFKSTAEAMAFSQK